MKFSTALLSCLTLVGTASAGRRGLAAGSAVCLAACTASLASCHAVGHGLSVFTFGLSSFVAFATCHQVLLGCEAACMASVAVAALGTTK